MKDVGAWHLLNSSCDGEASLPVVSKVGQPYFASANVRSQKHSLFTRWQKYALQQIFIFHLLTQTVEKVRSSELHQHLIFLSWLLWQCPVTTVSSFAFLTTLAIRDFTQTPKLIMALLYFKNSVLENLDFILRMEFSLLQHRKQGFYDLALVVLFLS